MFTNGKDKTFNALVYLHRYEKWIISKIRMDYLHKLQWNLEWQRRQIESSLVGAEWKDSITLEKSKNDILKKVDTLKALWWKNETFSWTKNRTWFRWLSES